MLKQASIAAENNIFDLWDHTRQWIKRYGALFAIYLLFGTAVYLMLISQGLVNSGDGIWHSSNYMADVWEWSLGRWLLPYLNKLNFGIVSGTLNSFITLILISMGNILLADLFQVRHRLAAATAGCLFIASPLVCATLSYCYTSAEYGAAYLFAVLSVYVLFKISCNLAAVMLGGFFLSCSLGCYQAYFGVTCIVLLVYFMRVLLQNSDSKHIVTSAIKSAGMICIGGVQYKIIVTLLNRINMVQLNEYKGTDSVSLRSILTNLSTRLTQTYREFYEFFFTDEIQVLNFNLKPILIIGFLALLCIIAFKTFDMFRAKSFISGILLVMTILALPVASNAAHLLTDFTTEMLMTGGMTLVFPLSICLLDNFMGRRLYYLGYMLIMAALLWVNICIVNNDQLALNEGKTSTVTLTQNIINCLTDEGYLTDDITVAIVGKPSANDTYAWTSALKTANDYAKFGDYWWYYGNSQRSWDGVLYAYCGVQLNTCSDSEYMDIVSQTEFKDIPCFPGEGSVCVMDGIVVVKVSDDY